jgi:hypothetical protein
MLPSLHISAALVFTEKEGMTMLWRPSNRWARKLATLLTLVALTLIGAAPALAAATTFTSSTNFPISLTVFVPCAAGGVGEFVDLSGNLHDLFSVTFDGSGGFHLKAQDNPQGLRGIGETTGAKYQGTGVTGFEFTGKVGFEETDVNNFRIIGQEPGNNFLVHDNFHITVNANGTVTSFHDNFSIDCK